MTSTCILNTHLKKLCVCIYIYIYIYIHTHTYSILNICIYIKYTFKFFYIIYIHTHIIFLNVLFYVQNYSENVSYKLKSVLTVHHLNAENPASFSERRREESISIVYM